MNGGLHTLSVVFFLVQVNITYKDSKMLAKVLRAIIMGPPGAGKGTISERIAKDFPFTHISSGDLLRQNILRTTAIGMEAKKYIESGKLVPDNTMVKLIVGELQQLSNESFLLDGFPRTVDQAEALNDQMPVDVVLNLNVPFEVIIERIKGRWVHTPSGRIYHTEFNPPKVTGKDDITGDRLTQRDDDKEETVKARLESYQRQTQPVLDYYRNLGVLEVFSGNYSNAIWPNVHAKLSTKLKPLQFTEYN